MSAPSLINLIRCVTTWERTTGLSADNQTNTMYVGSDVETDTDDIASVHDGMMDILAAAIDSYLSEDMFINLARSQYFDMLEPEPRVPFADRTHTLSLNSDDLSLPPEVSCALSFQGERVSGQPQARRRGRIYLPTFCTSLTEVSGGQVRWIGAAMAAIANAAEAMKSLALSNNCSWAVYSPTQADATIGTLQAKARAATTYVQSGWVDNEPDIQRRRGNKQGTKTPWA